MTSLATLLIIKSEHFTNPTVTTCRVDDSRKSVYSRVSSKPRWLTDQTFFFSRWLALRGYPQSQATGCSPANQRRFLTDWPWPLPAAEELECYSCNSVEDSRCQSHFNYTDKPPTAKCKGWCVKIVEDIDTGQYFGVKVIQVLFKMTK